MSGVGVEHYRLKGGWAASASRRTRVCSGLGRPNVLYRETCASKMYQLTSSGKRVE